MSMWRRIVLHSWARAPRATAAAEATKVNSASRRNWSCPSVEMRKSSGSIPPRSTGRDFFPCSARAVTVGGCSDSTAVSNCSAGMLATRTAVTCCRSDRPASRAACFCEVLKLSAPSVLGRLRPSRASNVFSSSPHLRIARAWIRSAIFRKPSSFACLA